MSSQTVGSEGVEPSLFRLKVGCATITPRSRVEDRCTFQEVSHDLGLLIDRDLHRSFCKSRRLRSAKVHGEIGNFSVVAFCVSWTVIADSDANSRRERSVCRRSATLGRFGVQVGEHRPKVHEKSLPLIRISFGDRCDGRSRKGETSARNVVNVVPQRFALRSDQIPNSERTSWSVTPRLWLKNATPITSNAPSVYGRTFPR